MVRLKCPRCATIIEAASAQTAVCYVCNFPGPDARRPTPILSPYAPSPMAPPTPYPPPQGPAPAPAYPPTARAPGKVRKPIAIPLLVLVTLFVYMYVWVWKITHEVDRYTGRPKWSSGRARTGVILALIGLGLYVVGFVIVVVGILSTLDASGQPDPDAAASGVALLGVIVVYGGAVVLFVGFILLYMALWRVWNFIREDETLRAKPKQLSPVMMLLFLIIPYVNIITIWIAFYKTQKGLNGVWRATGAPPLPA